MASKTVSPRARTTINVTHGALIYSGKFRGISLPGTPGGPKRQLTFVHNCIFGGDIKITVRLVRHGSYAVTAPMSLLESWSLCEPKLMHPLPLPKDADRLFVGSIIADGNREIVEAILRMDQTERNNFVESALHRSDPEHHEELERYGHHLLSIAYAVEVVKKARRASRGGPARGTGVRHGYTPTTCSMSP